MKQNSLYAQIFLIYLASTATVAHADIFAGTDAAGNPHFTNGPTQPGYAMIIAEQKYVTKNSAVKSRLNTHAQREYWLPLIRTTAAKYDFDAALLTAIISIESDFNPNARSSKGAVGLMQLMPTTAAHYHVSNAYDPAQNLNAGITYFKELLNQHQGNLALSLAAYNAGKATVLKHGQRIPPYRETMLYVSQVLARYAQYRSKEIY